MAAGTFRAEVTTGPTGFVKNRCHSILIPFADPHLLDGGKRILKSGDVEQVQIEIEIDIKRGTIECDDTWTAEIVDQRRVVDLVRV